MTIAYLHGQASACRPPIASRLTAVGSTRGRGTSRRTTVRVRGEVDAANAKEFAVAVYEAIPPAARSVTLDLSDLDFIAVDGIAALHAINAHLTRGGATWHVVPSRAVSRILDLCDPVGLIPRSMPERARGATA
ncbi:STAS domain-containing protein [Mycobacterium sp. NPDC050551]|uniref:STAS domain-containing protein n=1 Tax=Mycobacterium sp. NPDC050551 TaxID=3155407 RepID=UPI0034411348